MLKFASLIIGSAVVGSFSGLAAEDQTSTEIAANECGLAIDETASIGANELWALNYADVLQSPHRPLMRIFFHISSRQSEAESRTSDAILLFNHQYRNGSAKAFRIKAYGGASLGSVGRADDGTDYDFTFS